jgi:hypothetical protein
LQQGQRGQGLLAPLELLPPPLLLLLQLGAAEVAHLGQAELLDRALAGREGQLLLAALALQLLLVFGLELIKERPALLLGACR